MTKNHQDLEVIERLREVVKLLGISATSEIKMSSHYDRAGQIIDRAHHHGIAHGYLESSRMIDDLITRLESEERSKKITRWFTGLAQ